MKPGLILLVVMGAVAITTTAIAESPTTDRGSQTIYKSVAPDGTVTYSDEPIKNNVQLDTLTLQTAPDSANAAAESAAQIEQMAKTTERLKQDRLERDKLQLAKEELALVRQQMNPPMIYREEYYSSSYPYYPTRRYHHGHHRPHKPTPIHHRQRDLNNPAVLVPKSRLLTPNIPRNRPSSHSGRGRQRSGHWER